MLVTRNDSHLLTYFPRCVPQTQVHGTCQPDHSLLSKIWLLGVGTVGQVFDSARQSELSQVKSQAPTWRSRHETVESRVVSAVCYGVAYDLLSGGA
jgi:hypothetical protein